MDWLKDKPGLLWMLNTLSSVLLILLAFWLTGWSSTKNTVDDNIRNLQQNKTSFTYVDDRDKELSEEIDKKADKSLVESMDGKLDLILEKMN